MLQLKEYNLETKLQQQLEKLKLELLQTQQELDRCKAHNLQLEDLLQGVTTTKASKTITIKSATKVEFIQTNEIIYCNADYGYTDIILTNGKTITATKPLSKFEDLLKKHNFFRISKSLLVNTEHIVTFHKNSNQILLQGDILLKIARRRRVEFLKTLE